MILFIRFNNIKNNSFEGKKWQEQVNEIIQQLPENVYISFDIDGLVKSLEQMDQTV